MRIQVVHDQDYFLAVRVTNCEQAFNFFRPVCSRAGFAHAATAPAAQGFCKDENTAGPLPDIFRINFLVVTLPHWKGFPGFTEALVWFFVHAYHWKFWIVGQFIYIQHILHMGDKISILFWRDAPVII